MKPPVSLSVARHQVGRPSAERGAGSGQKPSLRDIHSSTRRRGLPASMSHLLNEALGLVPQAALADGPRGDEEEGPVRLHEGGEHPAVFHLEHRGTRTRPAQGANHRVQGSPQGRGHDAHDVLRHRVSCPSGERDSRLLEQEGSLERAVELFQGEDAGDGIARCAPDVSPSRAPERVRTRG